MNINLSFKKYINKFRKIHIPNQCIYVSMIIVDRLIYKGMEKDEFYHNLIHKKEICITLVIISIKLTTKTDIGRMFINDIKMSYNFKNNFYKWEKLILDKTKYKIEIINPLKNLPFKYEEKNIIRKIIKYVIYQGDYVNYDFNKIMNLITNNFKLFNNSNLIKSFFERIKTLYKSNESIISYLSYDTIEKIDYKPSKISISFKLLDTFLVSPKIGKGSYGEVRKLSNDKVIKEIDNDNIYDIKNTIIREVVILEKCNHPNIVNIESVQLSHYSLCYTIDFVDKPLSGIKNQLNNVSYQNKINLIKQLIDGVDYLHKNLIVHRDLSTNNVLVDLEKNIIKICDFGSSCFMDNYDERINSSDVCSLYFSAIELFKSIPKYNHKIDVWACGCLIYYIMNGNYIFESRCSFNIVSNILEVLGRPCDLFLMKNPWLKKHIIGFNPTKINELKNKFPMMSQIIIKMLVYEIPFRIEISEVKSIINSIKIDT